MTMSIEKKKSRTESKIVQERESSLTKKTLMGTKTSVKKRFKIRIRFQIAVILSSGKKGIYLYFLKRRSSCKCVIFF
jgi:hypothetical protein